MTRFAAALAALLFALVACGDDEGPTDGGDDAMVDATPDTGPPTTIEEIPPEEELSIPGLVGTVSAVQDARGMWHIYAESLDDATRAEGYLMARDRWGQMDLVRRSATGRLAELAGGLDPGQVDADIEARFGGYARTARQLLDTLPADEIAYLDAFTAGINTYLQAVRDGDLALPRGVADAYALFGNRIDDWSNVDTLAIARLQGASLSFDATGDLELTAIRDAVDATFPATSSDPVLAARADSLHDFAPFAPIFDVYTSDNFPNVITDSGSRALIRPRPAATTRAPSPSREQLAAARRFAARMESGFRRIFGADRGSNSWVVHGDQTGSGNPLLANDPHLGLDSPPLFWMVHVDTTRAGGDIDVQGLALAGTPTVLLGYNRDVAWGLTTSNFDVTDVYLEEITEVADGPDTVLYRGTQVPIQTVTETIEISDGSSTDVTFEFIDHADGIGGPRWIIPDTRTPTSAISMKWTGFEPTNELRAFRMMATAATVEDVEAAYENFGVGGQNLVAITADGDIFWSTQVNLPVRDARAMTYDPATRMGFAPSFVLPGTGEYEWVDFLSDRYLPHALNPSSGYIATANNDGVGTTSDGNPFDDDHYIGWRFRSGARISRIRERLDEVLASGDGATTDDMSDIQGDAVSPYGRLFAAAFLGELDRALEEAASPGTHPDLESAVAAIDATDVTRLEDARDRLAAWTSFDTPAAVEGSPSAEEIADSIATTIFNAAFGRIVRLALADEYEALGIWPELPGELPSDSDSLSVMFVNRTFARMLLDPATMATHDASLRDGAGDSVLWDDVSTPAVESRGERILSGFVDALAFLEEELGGDVEMWRWGRLHTIRLESLVPQIPVSTDVLSIPLFTDPMFPDGFPRHGDNDNVDASHYGIGATTGFTYDYGPVQRLVVEMTPERPLPFNALPGGQSIDPDSPHHADEMEHWRINEAPPMNWTEEEVLAAHERRFVFNP